MADVEPTREIVLRKDAIANGLKHYFTGKPCKRGHIEIRFTNNLTCYGCIKDRLARFGVENPEIVRKWGRESSKRNYHKHREKHLAACVKWQKLNPDRVKAATLKYTSKNADALRRKALEYYWRDPDSARLRSRTRYKNNPDKFKEYSKQRRALNPDLYRALGANRRALERNAKGKHTGADVLEILEDQGGRCAYCRKKLKRYHVDHIIPLTKGGTNDRRNLQILCQPCNQAKYNHDPVDFARKLGLLC